MTGTGVTGLRRFVRRAPGISPFSAPGTDLAAHPVPGAHPMGGTGAATASERCEMCGEVLDGRHGHVVDIEKRSITCACRACYLLFTHQGAAAGRYRSVPERVCHDPDRPLTDAEWNELQIPVAMAFFFFNSTLGRVVAGYPSPGGPTECELDLEAWDNLAARHPLLGAISPDVEAIFVNRTQQDGAQQDSAQRDSAQRDSAQRDTEAYLIPIDECYSLVGRLRLLWQGFDGGAEVRAALAAFLADLRRRARVLAPEAPERDRERRDG